MLMGAVTGNCKKRAFPTIHSIFYLPRWLSTTQGNHVYFPSIAVCASWITGDQSWKIGSQFSPRAKGQVSLTTSCGT